MFSFINHSFLSSSLKYCIIHLKISQLLKISQIINIKLKLVSYINERKKSNFILNTKKSVRKCICIHYTNEK